MCQTRIDAVYDPCKYVNIKKPCTTNEIMWNRALFVYLLSITDLHASSDP